VRRALRPRPFLPETGYRAIDDSGIDFGDSLVTDPELVGHTRTPVFHDDVRHSTQINRRLASSVRLKIEKHALLTRVEVSEHGAVPVSKGTAGTSKLVSGQRFDLADLCAHVCEQPCAVGAR